MNALRPLSASTICLIALASAACTVTKQDVPGLVGPSGLGVQLRVSATPDSLLLDGGSQSSILVEVLDANGAGKPGVAIRLDIAVGSPLTAQDCGTLSARNIVTGSDGKARAVFTAPPFPLPRPVCDGFNPGAAVTIVATPTSSNFATVFPETAQIRMVPPGIIVPPPDVPTAKFSFSPATPSANAPVIFDATGSCGGQIGSSGCTSISAIVSYVWDFGDGTPPVAGLRVTHSFAQQGLFNVKLTVTNDRGASSTTTASVAVGPSFLPVAKFTTSPAAPFVGDTVFFNASASTAGAGHTLVSYRWSFGDGAATATGVNTTHVYTSGGNFTVQLTVTDEAGQSVTNETILTVTIPASPTASFTVSPTLPAVAQPAVFDASNSKAAPGQTIVEYSWNFGDNTAIVRTSSPTVVHHYAIAGSYVVTLVVKDGGGRTGTVTGTVIVITAPGGLFATFTFSPTDPKPGQQVFFNASASTGNIVNYAFDYGDGSIDSGPNATQSHVFVAAGTYVVRLTIRDAVGLTQTTTLTVSVK